MSKFGKMLSALAIVMISLITLVGCKDDSYNFYEDWTSAGAKFSEDHIFEVISLDKANEMIENDETFVLLYGYSGDTYSPACIQTMQEQAEYLEYDGKVYFVETSSYNTVKGRKEVREKLNIPDMNSLTDVNVVTMVCCLYIDGDLEFGTYDGSNDDEIELFGFNKNAAEGSKGYINYEALSQYLFKDLKEQGVL